MKLKDAKLFALKLNACKDSQRCSFLTQESPPPGVLLPDAARRLMAAWTKNVSSSENTIREIDESIGVMRLPSTDLPRPHHSVVAAVVVVVVGFVVYSFPFAVRRECK